MNHTLKMKSHKYIFSTRIIIYFLLSFSYVAMAQNKFFSDEDRFNQGNEFSYDQPILPKNIWTIKNKIETTKADYENGKILKNIPPLPEWKNSFGLFPIWFGSKEYVFQSPLISGGQITVQWKDVEPKKGEYYFAKIATMLKAYYDHKLYTTIQINGNEKPDYLFDETPYILNTKWSLQVEDKKGTLMYWYPGYVENYSNLIKAFGNFLAKSAYLKSVIGIRFNFNAIGTEHIEIPEKVNPNDISINPRIATSYYYPEKADKTFRTEWTKTEKIKYERAVLNAYMTSITPVVHLFLRNNIDENIIEIARPDLESGKIGFFHTSSEPEPRSKEGERKLLLFNNYSRNRKTISYAEEWADCWGIHGKGVDFHFCSPEQWNYWRILSDLNVGISHIGMYGSIWAYALGEPAPNNNQFEDINVSLRREEIRRSIEFAFKYVGHHNNPAKSPGAFIAFRNSTENLSMAQNPEFYRKNPTSGIELFTNDYSFLSVRLPDNSKGLKLVGPSEQRFGAFARQIHENENMKIAFHPLLTKALYLKPLNLRVIYFDEKGAEWSLKYGDSIFNVVSEGTNRWVTKEYKVIGAERKNSMDKSSIIEKGQMASNDELFTLQPDVIITALKGSPTFHMIEIDRSSLYQ